MLTAANRCHGGAIFPGIIDPSTGKSVINGKRVTGFTTKGEEEEGVLETIRSWNKPTIEATAADAGAECMSSRSRTLDLQFIGDHRALHRFLVLPRS